MHEYNGLSTTTILGSRTLKQFEFQTETVENDNTIHGEKNFFERLKIHQKSKFRTYWDIAICIFAFWNCLTLPFEVAFRPESFESYANKAFNYFIDIVFALDILLNFRTTVVDDLSGDEIVDSK